MQYDHAFGAKNVDFCQKIDTSIANKVEPFDVVHQMITLSSMNVNACKQFFTNQKESIERRREKTEKYILMSD